MIPRIRLSNILFVVLIIAIVSIILWPRTSFAQELEPSAVTPNLSGQSTIHFLPYIYRAPTAPTLHINQNTFTPTYQVGWIPAQDPTQIEMYIVEESNDGFQRHVNRVYEGPNTSWQSPHKYPGTYSYRVAALVRNRNIAAGSEYVGYTPWSAVHSYTVWPLFVGLQAKWQGVGYINRPSRNQFLEVDFSRSANFLEITQDDIVRSIWADSYQHPQWDETDTWESYFSITTGTYLSGTGSGNSNFKWAEPYKLSYGRQFIPNKETIFAGQPFEITGPHGGVTVYGRKIQFWRMVNTERILFYDNGETQQYVEPGNAVLAYDTGPSGLLIHSNIIRREYQNGRRTNDTVNYIVDLNFTNAIDHASVGSLVDDTGIESTSDTHDGGGAERGASGSAVSMPSDYAWRTNANIAFPNE